MMDLHGTALYVQIFIGESDVWHHRSLYLAILELLRKEGCAGATVTRGIAGFGASSLIHTTTLVELSSDLPIVISVVDQPQRLARVLPQIEAMLSEGLLVSFPVDVHVYAARRIPAFPKHLTVADVMRRNVYSVAPDTSLAEIVGVLLDQALRSVPVIDAEGKPVGIITDGDLVRRNAIHLPVHLKQALPLPERAVAVTALEARPERAADVMTPHPLTIPQTTSLAQAARLLVDYDLKRVPVVDLDGRLMGMVSRGDLLGTIAEGLRQRPEQRPALPAGTPQTVADVMVRNVPTVERSTSLAETLEAILALPQRRVVVVDADRRVVGIITDGDVITRAARRSDRAGLRQLVRWLSGGERPPELEIQAHGRTAEDIMSSPVMSIADDTPILDAIGRLTTEQVVRMPVVDSAGRLVGLVGRAGLLRALIQQADPPNIADSR